MRSILFAFGVITALSGCAATGPAFSPVREVKAGQGVLYVYRPETESMSILSAIFDVDGQKTATLENNGYAAISVTAGRHHISHQWKTGVFGNSNLEGKPVFMSVNIKENEPTYVRLLARARWETAPALYPNIGINTHFYWALEEVPESIALPELQKTKHVSIEARKLK